MTDTTDNPFDTQDNSNPVTSNENPFDNLLSDIKNDDGEPKYKDVESALRALNHSQQFIKTLTTEKADVEKTLAEAQMEIDKRSSVEDIVTKLTSSDPNDTKKVDQPQAVGLDEEHVLNLVKKALNDQSSDNQQAQNLNSVVSKLSEAYGDDVKSTIAQVAKDAGTTASGLKELSKTNPTMVLKLFEKVETQSSSPSNTSLSSPKTVTKANEAPTSERKIMTGGASNDEVVDLWRKTREYVHSEMGITN